MERYSKKREAILTCLRGTKSHPTAEWIYRQLKPSLPDLSLATVYRNLGHLKAAGLVCSIGVVEGQERFDANTRPHSHTVCRRCGCVADLDMLPLPDTLTEAAAATGFSVETVSLQFGGVCAACRQK